DDRSQRPGALAGLRRSAIQVAMTSEDEQTASYEVRFLPPAEPGPAPPQPWMQEAACPDVPNSYYTAIPEGDRVRVVWGCERTSVHSQVDKQTGKILRATLTTEVSFLHSVCPDKTLTDCGPIFPDATSYTARLLLRHVDPQVPPERQMTNSGDGLEYIQIPPGAFTMGCVPHDADCYPREKPAHGVTLTQGFWIGRTEVPVEAFERYLAAEGGALPAEPGSGQMPGYNDGWRHKNYPMVKVTWEEARSYCAWAGGRLPTEAEWEYAARGGVEGTIYPWGDGRSHDEANFWRSGGRDRWKYVAPVGSFSANGFGLYDMAGNVYERTADWYDDGYYGRSPDADPPGPYEGRRRVARGGGGFLNTKVLRTSARLSADPAARNVGVGFRCVLPEGSSLALRQRIERLFSEASKLFE
ncbi:MAG: SUMF1/EgtB/PvdO family nonheme iron enzyme, partial [Acidobacteria bacterium]|nr:SUMF1/EgtB/PvdO family nonheme iron enzyme [Acidobacteriota bacterium]